jgi:hypothetical protein
MDGGGREARMEEPVSILGGVCSVAEPSWT